MKIEFGCGDNPTKPGFKTCDIRDISGIDFVCPAWDIDKLVEENSVDEIFSRHFFEHLTFQQGERMLEVWFKILKPGAKCEMSLPNMTYHIKQWIDGSNKDHARAGFWGWQRGTFDDVWDVHKSGYDLVSLTELVKSKGFVNTASLEKDKSKHLHIVFFKP